MPYDPYLWWQRSWEKGRSSQAFIEEEITNQLPKILKRVGLGFAIPIASVVFVKSAPYPYKPTINLLSCIAGIVCSASATRPIKNYRRATSSAVGLQMSEVNGLEHSQRHAWEHPPREAVTGIEMELPEQPEQVPDLNFRILQNATFMLIWGTQGSGKTTLAKRIARQREAAGHAITVLDPHGSAAEWGHWQVIGSGRQYGTINEALKSFDKEVTLDYQRYSEGVRDFDRNTLLCDEFTQWADHVDSAPKFVKSACSDLRKVKKCVILISHNDTLAGLGDAKGMKGAIDRSAIKIQLESEIGADGEYHSTGYGFIAMPGKEYVKVKIPQYDGGTDEQPAINVPAVNINLFDGDDSSGINLYASKTARRGAVATVELDEEDEGQPNLVEALQTLLQFMLEKGQDSYSARDIGQRCYYFSSSSYWTADRIRALFQQLATWECGELSGSVDRLRFTPYPDAFERLSERMDRQSSTV